MKTAMNVEIVELYPIDGNEELGVLTGTLRIKLPEIGVHILGIYFSKRKDCWHFIMPGRKGKHHMTGNIVRFPFIIFEDREKQDELMNILREKVPAFLEKRLTDAENPLSYSPKMKQPSKQEKTMKVHDNTTAPKKTASIDKPKQLITEKNWIDPPGRLKARNTSKFARR